MGEKVDQTLCDERSGNIQDSLKDIKDEIIRLRKKVDKIKMYACGNGMSTKKTITVFGSIIVTVQIIAEIIKATFF